MCQTSQRKGRTELTTVVPSKRVDLLIFIISKERGKEKSSGSFGTLVITLVDPRISQSERKTELKEGKKEQKTEERD